MSDSICSICLDPLSSPITAMTPCGHCFHMACIQQWAVAARELMDDYDEDEEEDDEEKRCLACPFCRKQARHQMRLFLELPPPFALNEDNEEDGVEDQADDWMEESSPNDDDDDPQERKMPATRSITAKVKEFLSPPAASTRSGRKRSSNSNEPFLQDLNMLSSTRVAKKQKTTNASDTPTAAAAATSFDKMKRIKDENKLLKHRLRQLQHQLVSQSRKHLEHERQQVDEMENLMSVATETQKSLALEQRRVGKCMTALEKFRDVDHGLQALVSKAFSEKEEAACNLAKLADMHATICSKLQLRTMPHRTAKGAAAGVVFVTPPSSSAGGEDRKILTHWFKRYELESIQKTLEEIHQMFHSDNDDDDNNNDDDTNNNEDDQKPNDATTEQRRITRSLSRQHYHH